MEKRKMILRATGIEIPIQKIFVHFGEHFAIHRPVYRYMNADEITINDKYWTVSHLKSGSSVLGQSGSWGKTIKEAQTKAIDRLENVGKDLVKEAVSSHIDLNEI